MVTQVLGHREVKFPTPRSMTGRVWDHLGDPRSMTGRLLFWDHLGDQISHILCPSKKDFDEPTINRGDLPVKLPAGVNIDEIAGPTPLPKAWNQKMKNEDLKERDKGLGCTPD